MISFFSLFLLLIYFGILIALAVYSNPVVCTQSSFLLPEIHFGVGKRHEQGWREWDSVGTVLFKIRHAWGLCIRKITFVSVCLSPAYFLLKMNPYAVN